MELDNGCDDIGLDKSNYSKQRIYRTKDLAESSRCGIGPGDAEVERDQSGQDMDDIMDHRQMQPQKVMREESNNPDQK